MANLILDQDMANNRRKTCGGNNILIHEADPQSRLIVIIVFAHVVRLSVRHHFSKQNNFQAKTVFATGETVGRLSWVIGDTCVIFIITYRRYGSLININPGFHHHYM